MLHPHTPDACPRTARVLPRSSEFTPRQNRLVHRFWTGRDSQVVPHLYDNRRAGRAADQRENLQALDLTMDDADRAEIARLPKDVRVVDPPFAPAW